MADDLSLNFNLNPEVSLEALQRQMELVRETLVTAAREATTQADKALANLGLQRLAEFRTRAVEAFATLSTGAGKNAKKIGEDFNATFTNITRGLQTLETRGTKALEATAANASKVAREASLGTLRNLEADGRAAIAAEQSRNAALDRIAVERGKAQIDVDRQAANADIAVQRDAAIAVGRAAASVAVEQGKTVEEIKRQSNAAQLALAQEAASRQTAVLRDQGIVQRQLLVEQTKTAEQLVREQNTTTEATNREAARVHLAAVKQQQANLDAVTRDGAVVARKIIEGENASTQALIVETFRRTTASKRAALQQDLQVQRSEDNLELAEVRGHQARLTEVWKRGWQIITSEQKNFITKHRENQRNANVLTHIEEQRKATESIETTKSQLRQQEELTKGAQTRLLEEQRLSQRASTITSSGVTGAVTGRSGLGIGIRNLAFLGGGLFGVASTIKIGQDFAVTLATVGVAANLTAAQLELVRKKAIELGADIALPGVSAKEGAEAIGLMAKSGINLTDALQGGARAALQLSRAAAVDVTSAVQIVDDSINVFRLSGRDAQRTVDDLVGSIKIAGGETIPEFANAFQSASAVFQSTFEGAASGAENFRQLNAAIDLLGRNGVRGETAGTAIRNALVRLTAPTAKGKKDLEEIAKNAGVMGSVLFDTSGKTRQFKDVVDILAKGLGKFSTEQERDTKFVEIFGAKSQIAARLLSEQSDVFKENLKVLTASETVYDAVTGKIIKQGAAARLAAAQNSGLKGAVDAVVSQFQTFQILLFELINIPAGNFLLFLAGAIDKVANDDAFHAIRIGLVGVAIAAAGLITVKAAAEGLQLLDIGIRTLATSPFALLSTGLLGAAFAIGFFSVKNKEFGDAIKVLGQELKDFGGQLVKDVIDGDFVKAKDDLLNIIKAIATFPLLKTLGDAVVKEGKDVLQRARELGAGIVSAILSGVGNTAHFVVKLITDVIRGDFDAARTDIANAARRGFELLPSAVVAVGRKVAEEIIRGFSAALDFGKVIWPKIEKEAVKIPGEVADFGAAIWRGIVAGFNGDQKKNAGLNTNVTIGVGGLSASTFGSSVAKTIDSESVQASIGEAIGRAVIAGAKLALKGIETAGKLLAEGLFNKFTIEGVAAVAAGLAGGAIIIAGTFIKGFAEGIDHNKGQIVEALAKIASIAIQAFLLAVKQLLLHSPIWLEIATAVALIFAGGKIFAGISQAFQGMQANLRSGLLALSGDFEGSRAVAADYQKSLRSIRVGEVDALGASLPAAARTINQGLVVPFKNAKAAALDFFASLRGENDLKRPLQIPTIPGLGIVPAVGPSAPLNPIIQPIPNLNFTPSISAGPSSPIGAQAAQLAALNAQINSPTGFTKAVQAAGAAAGIAAIGMASFFAFSSTDSTTRLITATTAIGGIVTAFATGGPIVGTFAVAAAGLGAILGNNAKKAKEARDRTKEWIDILKTASLDTQRQKIIDDFSQKILDGDKNATAFARNLNGDFGDLADAILGGSTALQAFKDKLLDNQLTEALAGQGSEAGFVAQRLKDLTSTGDTYAEAVKHIRGELEQKAGFDFIDQQGKAYADATAKQDLLRAAIGKTATPQEALSKLSGADAKSRADALVSARDLLDTLAGRTPTINNLALSAQALGVKIDEALTFQGPIADAGKLKLELENTKNVLANDFVAAAQTAIDTAIQIGEDPVTAVNNLRNELRDKLVKELGISTGRANDLLGIIDQLAGKRIDLRLSIAADAASRAILDKAFALAALANPNDFGVDIGATILGLRPAGAARGMIVTKDQLIRVAEGNKPEVIIPLDDPARAQQLAAQSGLLDLLGATAGASFAAAAGAQIRDTTITVNVVPLPNATVNAADVVQKGNNLDDRRKEIGKTVADFDKEAGLEVKNKVLVPLLSRVVSGFKGTALRDALSEIGLGTATGAQDAAGFGLGQAQADNIDALSSAIGDLAALGDDPRVERLKVAIGADLADAIDGATTQARGLGQSGSEAVEILEGEIQKGLIEKFGLSQDAAANLVAEVDKIARDVAVNIHFSGTADALVKSVFAALPAGDAGIDIGATVLGLIPHAAAGAIIDHEQIVLAGERGRKEAIIPLEDPDRAFALMVATGLDKLVSSRTARETVATVTPAAREAPLIGELHVNEVAGDPTATGIIAGRHITSIIQGALV